MYRFQLLILLWSLPLFAAAQNTFSVKGVVKDTSINVSLTDASVSILNAKDSTLVEFSWVRADGSFMIGNLRPGDLILLVVYDGYADYVEHFKLGSDKNFHDFGKISLVLKARLLQEVIINGYAAIKIKGDTTQYDASNYKIQPNDRVEDLLKQLPGIQVDQHGVISAQGKTVSRVYVEGEEFFGDDPTLVTKNIRADMVDKVQVFDKKSEQAAFTGVDDGEKEKAINVTLKADKKNGYFGKADLGGATDDYHQGQGMFNYFTNKQKLAVYGTIGNTNRTGLSRQETSRYAPTSPLAIVNPEDLLESFTGRYTGEGLPSAKTGGVHYDRKWDSDKKSINLNYKTGSINVTGQKNITTQNTLIDRLISANSGQTAENYFFRQKLDATYQTALGKTADVRVTADGTLSNNQTITDFNTVSTNDLQQPINDQSRRVSNRGDQQIFNFTALLTKKFTRPGRTASLSLNQSYFGSQTRGFLYSLNRYYTNGSVDSMGVVDQYKPTESLARNTSANLTYSEPVTKTWSLLFNAGLAVDNADIKLRSYNQSTAGIYDVLDQTFSSAFNRSLVTTQAGAIFSYVNKKASLSFGTKIFIFADDVLNLDSGINLNRDYLNWAPQGRFRYAFTEQRDLLLRFTRNTNQPTVNQLQPVRLNIDPLNVQEGNPNLKPSYDHNFILIFNSYGLSGSGILVDGSFTFSDNAIVNSIVTNDAGRSTFRYVNLDNRTTTSFNVSFSASTRLSRSKVNISGLFGVNGGTTYNYINGNSNRITFNLYSAALDMFKTVVKKYDYRLSIAPGYQASQSSLRRGISNNGWIIRSSGSLNLYLPGKIVLGTNANYLYQGRTKTFNNSFGRVIINSSLTKNFLKGENFSLAVSGNDLLNQNNGFLRNVSGANFFTQTQFSTIRRYIMLSMIYDFNKTIAAK